MRKKKPDLNKYGYLFKSGLELIIADQLEEFKVEWEYESDYVDYYQHANGHCVDCDSTDILIHRIYNPDFVLTRSDGSRFYLEGKGKFDRPERSKMLAVKKTADIDVRMVFQVDNWMTKTHANRYSDWCRQKGYQCSVQLIPKEWLKGVVLRKS